MSRCWIRSSILNEWSNNLLISMSGMQKGGTDRERGSKDHESGIEMLALSVNPLSPELCWTRPLTDWLARQLCQFKHLFGENPKRKGWIAHGNNAGRGPDCDPLFTQVESAAKLSDALLENDPKNRGPQ